MEYVAADTIAKLISSLAKQHEEVTGSSIGIELKRHYPEFDIRRQYGGLRRFIGIYCEGTVDWVRKQGGDDIYRFVGSSEINGPRIEHAPEPVGSPWQAFTNPSSGYELAINVSSGDLHVQQAGQPTPDFLTKLQTISPEEYREMCRDFLVSVKDYGVSDLEEVISRTDFWAIWSRSVRQHNSGKVYLLWLDWRLRAIRHILMSRLAALQLPDHLRNSIIDAIFATRKTSELRSAPKTREEGKNPESVSGQDIRAFALAAVAQMSEKDLRQLWLPLGSIFDATRASGN